MPVREPITAPEPTAANADLWARYFQDQWRGFLNPLGLPENSPVAQIAEGTAARVANFLTAVAGGPIAWLYAENAPNVRPLAPERPTRERALEHADLSGARLDSVEDFAA